MPRDRTASPLGQRIIAAAAEAGVSLTAAERRAGFAGGNLNRIVYGERAKDNLNVMRMKALADLLGVSFEWLCLGTGPRRPLTTAQADAVRAFLLKQLEQLESPGDDTLDTAADRVPIGQQPRQR